MSLEYPCVHHKNGWCYFDPEQPDACVFGPCDNETPSRGDRIRRMSDEELSGTIYTMQKALCIHFAKTLGFPIEELKFEEDAPDILEWLKQPAKGD